MDNIELACIHGIIVQTEEEGKDQLINKKIDEEIETGEISEIIDQKEHIGHLL